jgi:SAM-dependent methyltransferase
LRREGDSLRAHLRENGLLDTVIRPLEGQRIPWPDSTFDLVLSNQVFEHVEKLDVVIDEIRRVLKPGALLVALFPTRETIREGHIGIPFVHWLPRGRIRHNYASGLRALGLGHDAWATGETADAWTSETLAWLDSYVFYRRRSEILTLLRRGFRVSAIEDDYLAYRLGHNAERAVKAPLARVVSQVTLRLLAGTAVVCEKR